MQVNFELRMFMGKSIIMAARSRRRNVCVVWGARGVRRARALVCAHFLSDWLAIEGVRRPACARIDSRVFEFDTKRAFS